MLRSTLLLLAPEVFEGKREHRPLGDSNAILSESFVVADDLKKVALLIWEAMDAAALISFDFRDIEVSVGGR